jgi:hypothetical protein
MRIRITFDGASEQQVRALSVAMHHVLGSGDLTLKVEGPECWTGSTPHLTPNQFADLFGGLVKYRGRPIGDVLKGDAS